MNSTTLLVKSNFCWTPVLSKTVICQCLLTHTYLQGADASDTNDRDQTPLYCAVEHQHTAAAHLLCSASPATVNKADEWGLTPLHIASRSGNVNIVTALLLCQVNLSQFGLLNKRYKAHFLASLSEVCTTPTCPIGRSDAAVLGQAHSPALCSTAPPPCSHQAAFATFQFAPP